MTTIAAKSPKAGGPVSTAGPSPENHRAGRGGLTYPDIERAAGISKGAIYYWIRADSAGPPGYQGFRRRFYLARTTGYGASGVALRTRPQSVGNVRSGAWNGLTRRESRPGRVRRHALDLGEPMAELVRRRLHEYRLAHTAR
jgi:hypothetical protein